MDDLQKSNKSNAVVLTAHEKKLLVLQHFQKAAVAYEEYKSTDFNDLDGQAKYVLAAEHYNVVNRKHGSGDPDILVLPISELIDLYQFEAKTRDRGEEENLGMLFDLNPEREVTAIPAHGTLMAGRDLKAC